jgi:hypothetical protein
MTSLKHKEPRSLLMNKTKKPRKLREMRDEGLITEKKFAVDILLDIYFSFC